MIIGFVFLVANLWYVTITNSIITSETHSESVKLATKALEKAQERSAFLQETTRGMESISEVEDRLSYGILRFVEYCTLFPEDGACDELREFVVENYDYCKLNDNTDKYCTDSAFVKYLRDYGLIDPAP